MILLPVWIVIWTMFLALTALVRAVGLITVLYLTLRRLWGPGVNVCGAPITVFTPAWAELWNDYDQGVMPSKGMTPFEVYVNSALRNGAAGLRFIGFGFPINPAKIRGRGVSNLYAAGSHGWSLAWQGVYAGFWLKAASGWEFRIGWCLIPQDASPATVNPKTDPRAACCGFTFQLARH